MVRRMNLHTESLIKYFSVPQFHYIFQHIQSSKTSRRLIIDQPDRSALIDKPDMDPTAAQNLTPMQARRRPDGRPGGYIRVRDGLRPQTPVPAPEDEALQEPRVPTDLPTSEAEALHEPHFPLDLGPP